MTLKLTPANYFTLILCCLMLLLTLSGTATEHILEYNREDIFLGEYWRLLSANFVHFGWVHLAMNIAAFVMVGGVLLREITLTSYLLLLLSCCLAVSIGLLLFTPEMLFYRGFSGVIHGLILVGIYLNRKQSFWLSLAFAGLVAVKIIHEQQPGFEENDLQALLPVKVAVDSHLYGAIMGCVFSFFLWLVAQGRATTDEPLQNSKKTHNNE